MRRRYELSNRQWERIARFFPDLRHDGGRGHPWKPHQTAIAPEASARLAVFPADCTRRERSAPSARSAHRRALRVIHTASYYLSVAAWTQGFKLRWRLVWIDIGGTGINCASSRDSAFRWNVMRLLL